MRRWLAIGGLCLLLALAGCSFLPGADSGEPPGVEDGELADSEALLEAHESSLTESGYSHELTVNQTLTRDDRTLEDARRQRVRVAPGATEYERQVIYVGSARVIAWGNETDEFSQIEQGDQVQYRRDSPDSPTAMAGVHILESHLTAPFEVVDTEEADGLTLTTLEATGEPTHENAFPSGTDRVDGYDARVVVDGDGRIHDLEAAATYEVDGEPGSYRIHFELTSTDDPGVERPSWVDEMESADG